MIMKSLLDRNSPIPLYYQLKELIVELIENGSFRSGTPLPTEARLTEVYQISRVTVRHAMDELEHDGIIYRIAGKGTFIIRNKVKGELSRMTSFSEDMQALGDSVSSKILEFKEIPPPPSIAERMSISVNTRLIYINRLRLVEGLPIAINISYLHLPIGISITRTELEQTGSLWSLLESKGLPLRVVKRTIEAIAADSERARLLSMPAGAPLLLVEGITYTDAHFPVEFHQVINRGDRYKYSISQSR